MKNRILLLVLALVALGNIYFISQNVESPQTVKNPISIDKKENIKHQKTISVIQNNSASTASETEDVPEFVISAIEKFRASTSEYDAEMLQNEVREMTELRQHYADMALNPEAVTTKVEEDYQIDGISEKQAVKKIIYNDGEVRYQFVNTYDPKSEDNDEESFY